MRLPSASGLSSHAPSNYHKNVVGFPAVDVTSSAEGGAQVTLPKYQQFAKFVSEKRIQWLNAGTGHHMEAVAKQSEEVLNQSQNIENKEDGEESPKMAGPKVYKRTKT
jgi:hypothetical protein